VKKLKHTENGYLKNGDVVYIKEVTAQGYLVYHYYQTDDGQDESLDDRLQFYPFEKVFANAVDTKKHETIQELNDQIREKHKALEKATRELRDRKSELMLAESKYRDQFEYLKKYEILKNLSDMLDGELPFYVYWGYQEFRILNLDEACKTQKGNCIDLLTLSYQRGAQLTWKMKTNFQAHEQGLVTPCKTLKEAQETASKLLAEKEGKHGNIQVDRERYDRMIAAGITVPKSYIERMENHEKKLKEYHLQQKLKEYHLLAKDLKDANMLVELPQNPQAKY
jgi:hypothetical protein